MGPEPGPAVESRRLFGKGETSVCSPEDLRRLDISSNENQLIILLHRENTDRVQTIYREQRKKRNREAPIPRGLRQKSPLSA